MSTDDNITKPTIEIVLERINSLGEKFDSRMGALDDRMIGLEGRMISLEGEVAEIRNDLRTGLRKVEHKIDYLNKNILQVIADQKDLEERVENLESKAS